MSTALLTLVVAFAPPLGAAQAAPQDVGEAWARMVVCREAAAAAEAESDLRFERLIACGAAAREILRLGDDSDRDRLWELRDSLPDSDWTRGILFESLVESYAAEAVRALEPAPLVPTTPPADREVPDALRTASEDLRRAYFAFEDLSRRPDGDASPGDERIAYSTTEGHQQFERVVSDYLRDRTGGQETLHALERFVYGGFCGNGAQGFEHARAAVRLIESIRRQGADPDAAMAYVLSDGQTVDATARRVLGAAGLDWELLFVGGVASGQAQLLDPLVRGGSDRAARLLLEVADLASAAPDDVPGAGLGFVPRLATLVTPDGPCEGYATFASWDAPRDEDAPPIDAQLQQAILDRLERSVQPGVGLEEATDASHALLRLCRSESREAFRAMRRSPYAALRAGGTMGLRALGETVADPRAAAPVGFRLLVDGKPWSRSIRWELGGPDASRSGGGGGDRDGVVELERDPFLDPVARVETIELRSADLESPDGSWFSLRVARPLDLDRRTLVSVRTSALTVVVPQALPTSSDPPRLTLRTTHPDLPSPFLIESITGRGLPARAGRFLFAHLQRHRRYQASLTLPDGTVLESEEVELGAQPATVTLHAQPRLDEEEILEAPSPEP